MAYTIRIARPAEAHLRALTARQRRLVVDTIERQLSHEPTRSTRHRKPMRDNPIAHWELRVGDLRVYYDVEDEFQMATVVAVGLKEGNVVRIGGEAVNL